MAVMGLGTECTLTSSLSLYTRTSPAGDGNADAAQRQVAPSAPAARPAADLVEAC
jgi:hypothetical protein